MLASQIGVSRVTVSQWENGEVTHIRPENLFALANILKVNPEWLVTGNGERSRRATAGSGETTEALRQALPYIHLHQNKVFVVHLPDTAVFSDAFHNIVNDLTLLSTLGIQLVLVHGARQTLDRTLKKAGFEYNFDQGRRITTQAMLPHIQQAVGAVKLEIEARFSMGSATSLMQHPRQRIMSGNLIAAQPVGILDGVDYGHAGRVRRIDIQAIRQHLQTRTMVLLSPVGYSATGEVFNLASTELAQEAAIQLKADKLIYLSEPFSSALGLQPPAFLPLSEARAKIQDHELLGCLVQAVANGVHRGHLLDYQLDGCLLCEILTRDGSGLMVSSDPYEDIRPATHEDIAGIMDILRPLEQSGVLIPRSRERLEQDIHHFSVIDRDGLILGCAALYPYVESASAELACLATHPAYRRQGYGEILLNYSLKQAKKLRLKQVFILTTQSMHWFLERGFHYGSPDDLPKDRQGLYNWQRHSRIMTLPLGK
ncbi:MAG: amino-acid N-acetyltransferase [Gammaproteobacteria bacterium]|nr:MAG: amino-acid N-acetyltransferase [Gammaproteobacteria bacterium]